jgi:hypothetical protein
MRAATNVIFRKEDYVVDAVVSGLLSHILVSGLISHILVSDLLSHILVSDLPSLGEVDISDDINDEVMNNK